MVCLWCSYALLWLTLDLFGFILGSFDSLRGILMFDMEETGSHLVYKSVKVVHLDIKIDNVMIDPRTQKLKLIDFSVGNVTDRHFIAICSQPSTITIRWIGSYDMGHTCSSIS